jgi:hypothetical protein
VYKLTVTVASTTTTTTTTVADAESWPAVSEEVQDGGDVISAAPLHPEHERWDDRAVVVRVRALNEAKQRVPDGSRREVGEVSRGAALGPGICCWSSVDSAAAAEDAGGNAFAHVASRRQ